MIGHCPGETLFAQSLLGSSADVHLLSGREQGRSSAHSGLAPVSIPTLYPRLFLTIV